MKIGVFGDSFGDDYTLWPNPYTEVGSSWIDYLRDQNIEVDNFSSGGTSLYYSYQRFISNYTEYDKIIFAVTSPGRITVPSGTQTEDYFNVIQVEKELKSCFDFERKIKLNAIRDYFIYVKNDTFDNLTHKLLVDHISKKHDNILMIPCFVNSGIDNQIPLFNISHFEANFWNLEEILPNTDTVYDARKCHMCEENNLMLGKEIVNWVNTGNFILDSTKFMKPGKEFNHYFRTDYKILRNRAK
jgi:hypothetical protein